MIKINTCIGFLIISLLFIYSPAFPQSLDTSNYEKDYHRFVDSKEPLASMKYKDIQLFHSYYRTAASHWLIPSKTIKYGHKNLQELDIYTQKGIKPAPVIFFIHSGSADKDEVQYAVHSWLSRLHCCIHQSSFHT
jgi:hypothetical protein